MHVGGCQNYGSFLGLLNTRCRLILRTPKKTIIFDNYPCEGPTSLTLYQTQSHLTPTPDLPYTNLKPLIELHLPWMIKLLHDPIYKCTHSIYYIYYHSCYSYIRSCRISIITVVSGWTAAVAYFCSCAVPPMLETPGIPSAKVAVSIS